MMPTTIATATIPDLALRLMPAQQDLLFRCNALQWSEEDWTPTSTEQGILNGLTRLDLLDETSGQITHRGLQVVGHLTLTRLRQDP